MKLHPSNLVKATLLGFVLTLSISCNKDSDLLAEYVVENPKNILLNDIVIGTLTNQPIVIDPIDQKTHKEPDKVIITEVTPPKMGNTVINGDNTITYTPDTDKTGTDEFDYTTNITNPDNTTTTETGKVTVTVTEKTPTTKPTEMGELKAFPGAEGFGKNATGGRGGRVIQVTNLNASGSGSLRAALEASGARTIVFRTGGTINLNGAIINVTNPDFTIAGETAPGDGILVRGGTIAVSASNVIIRHMRFRGSANGDDALRIRGFGKNYTFPLSDIIVDHCSFSWSNDENISIINAKNVTIQKSILTGASYNILAWSNKDLSVLNNILALSSERHIETNQALGEYLVFEEINNLIYGFNWGVGMGIGLISTIENNIFEGSNSFRHSTTYPISFTKINPSYVNTSNPESMTYVYESGNTIDASFLDIYDRNRYPIFMKPTPLYRSTYNPRPTAGLKDALLVDAGAFVWNRDKIDSELIANINAKTGTIQRTGTFPTIKSGTPYPDADGDGMDDNWEIANNLNPKDPSDGAKDRDGDGYTNLEEFLYSLTLK